MPQELAPCPQCHHLVPFMGMVSIQRPKGGEAISVFSYTCTNGCTREVEGSKHDFVFVRMETGDLLAISP
jgi:hypothetical protein